MSSAVYFVPPCTPPPKERETENSLILRTLSIALGILLLIASLFILREIPYLEAIGIVPSLFLCCGGMVTLTLGLFLRCFEKEAVLDPLIYDKENKKWNEVDVETNKTISCSSKYISLSTFLKSHGTYTVAIRDRLLKSMPLKEIKRSLYHNFGTSEVHLALRVNWKNGLLDEEHLLDQLNFILMPMDALFSLPLDEIAHLDSDRKRVLDYRLERSSLTKRYPENTLGWLLASTK